MKMKKTTKIAGLMLFLATGAAIGMETTGKLYVQNRLTSSIPWGGDLPQRIRVTEKSAYYFANEPIIVKSREMKLLGDISSIKQIEVEQMPKVTLKYAMKGTVGKVTEAVGMAAKSLMGLYFVDITDKFFEFLNSPNYKGKDIVINFDWEFPDAYLDKSELITFENKE